MITEWKNRRDAEVASWNMAGAFLQSLAELREFVTRKSIEGDLLAWHRGLKAIYRWVFFKCKQDQRVEITSLIKKADAQVIALGQVKDGVSKHNTMLRLEEALNNLDFALTNALFSSGVIFPIPEEDISIEERLEREFHE